MAMTIEMLNERVEALEKQLALLVKTETKEDKSKVGCYLPAAADVELVADHRLSMSDTWFGSRIGSRHLGPLAVRESPHRAVDVLAGYVFPAPQNEFPVKERGIVRASTDWGLTLGLKLLPFSQTRTGGVRSRPNAHAGATAHQNLASSQCRHAVLAVPENRK